MFDKYLCKRIQKKQITIGDVIGYTLVRVFKLIAEMLMGVVLLFATGILTVIMICPFVPPYYNPSCLDIFGMGLGTLIWVTNIGIITYSILSVRIATCPKKQ